MCCSRNREQRQQRREQRRLATLQVLERITNTSSKRNTQGGVAPSAIDNTTTRGTTPSQPPAYSEAVAHSQTRPSTEKSQLAELEEMERRHVKEKNAFWARFSKSENKGY